MSVNTFVEDVVGEAFKGQEGKPFREDRLWHADRAFAAGYVTEDGTIRYLTMTEVRFDKHGHPYYGIGLTSKLHHAKLFGSKRKFYDAKKYTPLAPRDQRALEYLSKSFPVPVYARPRIPNYNMGAG